MRKIRKILNITVITTLIATIAFIGILKYIDGHINGQIFSFSKWYTMLTRSEVKEISFNRGKPEFKLKGGTSTEKLVKFLNDKGYQITLDEILNNPEKGVSVFRQYQKDYMNKDEEINLYDHIYEHIRKEGYL